MELDHSHTKVVLIANSIYPYWPKGNIKNIQVNFDKLKELLCDSKLIGIKNPENICELHNNSKIDIQLAVNKTAKSCSATDNLIIYYAGHGLLDIGDLKKVYLTTNDTRIDDKKVTCISAEDLKEPLVQCKASNKIMILDCCFAAKAAGLQSDSASLSGNIWGNTEGVYFMMSSDTDEPSRYDPNDDTIPTFFTQKLIDTISEGSPNSDQIWTLDDIFNAMKHKWDKNIAPEPINLTFKEIGRMPFCYNRYKINATIPVQSAAAANNWAEIEKNPNEDNIAEFIYNYPEATTKAMNLWTKMNTDWTTLHQVLSKNSFEALRAFVESNPVAPVKRAALDKMKSISVETRDTSLSKPASSARADSREKIGNAASASINPVRLKT